jgi:hypothetical protein
VLAAYYSETADTSQRMQDVIAKLDPLGSKIAIMVPRGGIIRNHRHGELLFVLSMVA